ncbi:MAG: hypothetical protein JSW06_11060 [Thermoplasmatales archaeon]|nr:MAG: hypothetical protein JSW06_11060 [Thermoplasmatales archaeon]
MTNKLLTVKGLKYMTYASLTAIGWGLMSFLNVLYYHLNDYLNDIMLWFAGFLLILYLVGVVLFMLGLYEIWKGRHEFGNEHKSNLEKTLWIIILVLVISAFISGPIGMFGYNYIFTSMIPFFLITLLILITPLYLIKTLSTPLVRKMLIFGVSFFVVLYLVSITMRYILEYYYWDMSLRTLSILSDLIPYILLFIAYYKTLNHIRNKEIKTI